MQASFIIAEYLLFQGHFREALENLRYAHGRIGGTDDPATIESDDAAGKITVPIKIDTFEIFTLAGIGNPGARIIGIIGVSIIEECQLRIKGFHAHRMVGDVVKGDGFEIKFPRLIL